MGMYVYSIPVRIYYSNLCWALIFAIERVPGLLSDRCNLVLSYFEIPLLYLMMSY